eukprot:15219360-Ditylum_brightwellii.AAC.1
MHITIAGNHIIFTGEVSTPTASLKLVKLTINSVLSRPNARFCSFDVSNFYLGTPMERPEYIKIKLTDITQEFMDKYNLYIYENKVWVFFKELSLNGTTPLLPTRTALARCPSRITSLSPHKHHEINYGAKKQYTHTASPGPSLDKKGVKQVQENVGIILFYARTVNNKLLVALNTIGIQQASVTEVTNKAVAVLLDYVATYPNDGILYHASNMVLAAHVDAGCHNETKGCSRAGSHIFLAKNDPYPHWNGAILTVAQIINFVVASAAKAELGALFIDAQKILPLCQTLIKMGWLQPHTPIQTDNTTAVGVVNKTLVSNKLKSMDFHNHWLHCCVAQEQFRFYWDKGPNNLGDYSTKHHPPVYHESKHLLFVGAASLLCRTILSQTL